MVFIQGEKVDLCPLQEDAAKGSYPAWLNDADVCRHNSHHVWPYTVEQAREYIQSLPSRKDALVLAIIEKETNTHVGNIALLLINLIDRNAEIAFLLGDKKSWGKGYGTEAGRLLLNHAFMTMNLHRVYCGTSAGNIGMQKVAQALRMTLEGTRSEAHYKDGQYVDLLEYGILKETFLMRTTQQ
jgi:[ribosomal protein S5]-alanine N-acetyltransferase